MTNLTLLLLINSLYCGGLWTVTKEGMLLEAIGRKAERLPEFIYKPLLGCCTCMSSIHGALFFFCYNYFTETNILLIIPYIFALAGLNNIYARIID